MVQCCEQTLFFSINCTIKETIGFQKFIRAIENNNPIEGLEFLLIRKIYGPKLQILLLLFH